MSNNFARLCDRQTLQWELPVLPTRLPTPLRSCGGHAGLQHLAAALEAFVDGTQLPEQIKVQVEVFVTC